MNALEISQVSKKFGKKVVIDEIDLVVPQHMILGFIGQNGAGKTTMMKMILGLLKPDHGSVNVYGERVTYGETKTNRHIGYLPDIPNYYGFLNAVEYLELCGNITGMAPADISRRSNELLELVGLNSNKTKRISGYSRGMRQRLGIAQALLNSPKLLICDEPTSALDPMGRKEILEILMKVKENTTVIFSTHILSDVERICENIAVLDKGKIVLSGTLADIRSHYKVDRIQIDFRNELQMQSFIKDFNVVLPENKEIITSTTLSIHSSDIDNTEKEIMKLLYEKNIMPVSFQLQEPTLEKLFVEVLQ